jgi:hypothetical protein
MTITLESIPLLLPGTACFAYCPLGIRRFLYFQRPESR